MSKSSNKIFRLQDVDSSSWKSTETNRSEFITMMTSSGHQDRNMMESTQRTDTSGYPLLRHETYTTDSSYRTPQKRGSSSSAGFFRPFDTPPKKIQKLSIDSNNNLNHLADNGVELLKINSFRNTLLLDHSRTFTHGVDNNCLSFEDERPGYVQKTLTSYHAGQETHSRERYMPSAYPENLLTQRKEISTIYSKNKSEVKASIFRTIDLLAHPTSSTTTTTAAAALSVYESAEQRHGYSRPNFCTSTPLVSHKKFQPSPFSLTDQQSTHTAAVPVYESAGQHLGYSRPDFCTSTPAISHKKFQPSPFRYTDTPLTYEFDGNFHNRYGHFGAPTNITTLKLDQPFPIQDKPQFTPANIVKPKPNYPSQLPHLSNRNDKRCGVQSSGKLQESAFFSDTIPQFNIDGANEHHRDFKINNNHIAPISSKTTQNPASYMDFKTCMANANQIFRSATFSRDPNSSIGITNLVSVVNVFSDLKKDDVFVRGDSIVTNPTSNRNNEEISDEKLIDVTTLDARFECRVCQKMFSQQRLLDRHAKRHSDVKRSICTFCNKGFSDAFDLKRHVRTHTGVRPFKCEDCGKAFTQRGSLELHTSKVHKRQLGYAFKQRRNKVYVCELCGHSEEQEKDYNIHLELNHPESISRKRNKRPLKLSGTALLLLTQNSAPHL